MAKKKSCENKRKEKKAKRRQHDFLNAGNRSTVQHAAHEQHSHYEKQNKRTMNQLTNPVLESEMVPSPLFTKLLW